MSSVQRTRNVETREAGLRPVEDIAAEAGFVPDEVEPYGRYMAKMNSERAGAAGRSP